MVADKAGNICSKSAERKRGIRRLWKEVGEISGMGKDWGRGCIREERDCALE